MNNKKVWIIFLSFLASFALTAQTQAYKILPAGNINVKYYGDGSNPCLVDKEENCVDRLYLDTYTKIWNFNCSCDQAETIPDMFICYCSYLTTIYEDRAVTRNNSIAPLIIVFEGGSTMIPDLSSHEETKTERAISSVKRTTFDFGYYKF